MIRRLEPGEFAQGTIFTCGVSESYPDVPALGMLITARCDTAQDKAEVYNYIPVIPVDAWIVKDGLELVARRSSANEFGLMKKALVDAAMSPSIIDLIDHNTILSELQAGVSKNEMAITKRFQNALQSFRESNDILNTSGRTRTNALSYLENNTGLYKSVIKELMTNTIAEFHYLERSEIGEETRGYVALMREIRFISAALGKRIAIGLDAQEFGASGDAFAPGLNHIRFSAQHDFAMPLSSVSSPFIELIMQRFAILFSRIGVDDIPKDRITEAHSWVKLMQGTN